jgi:hypothetical protein
MENILPHKINEHRIQREMKKNQIQTPTKQR